jgi:chorismate mutase/prephenate dehydratase
MIATNNNINNNQIIIGIQGGQGSFNEAAILKYLRTNQINQYQLKYLHTSHKVLAAVSQQQTDYGLFASCNSLGGLVAESIQAMDQFKFKIEAQIDLKIRHYLMKRKQDDLDQIQWVMSHPQVLKQCQQTLEQSYPSLKPTTSQGDAIDTAYAAELLATSKLKQPTAVLGPKSLAQIYNLEIIDQDLQDRTDNYTTFLLVSSTNKNKKDLTD